MTLATPLPTEQELPTALCDVLIIGGGPAGATAAALLAEQGRHVVVLEKAHHPRFHIGESLLPANVALFDKLGLREQIEAIGMQKHGVEFVSPDHDFVTRLEFSEAWDKSMPYAWQVRRSEMDEMLFRNATVRGAETLEGWRVRDVAFDDDGATVQALQDDGARRTWRAKFVIDASGRDTFLSNKFKAKQKNPKHNSAALYGHFANALRGEGKLEGNITIFWFAHGWFWYIPLADGTTSVGAVCWPYYLKSRTKPVKDFFADTIAMCPQLVNRLKGATLVDEAVYATGNYSYTSSRCSGQRYLMLGDAFTFVDPVFSSGVYLAMHNAFESVGIVTAALDRPKEVAVLMQRFERYMRKGPREFSWFIYRVTSPTMRDFFMYPQNPLRVKDALMSLLAGDIHGKTPIWNSLRVMKTLYFTVSAFYPKRTWTAWKRRRQNIRDLGPLNGENVVEAR
jgi:flavin-dependent dehydrogenase